MFQPKKNLDKFHSFLNIYYQRREFNQGFGLKYLFTLTGAPS